MNRFWTSLFSAAAPAVASSLLLFSSACSDSNAAGGARLAGAVKIDGSSTAFPISEAVAEDYRAAQPDVRVTVALSGTGGGFKKFVRGETDINDASRPIKQKEIDGCKTAGIDYLELPVAYDGIAVVVNPANDFVDTLSIAQLKKIWDAGSTVKTWADVDPSWPAEEIKLFAPGVDSGTFDYFTEVVNEKQAQCRSDFTASEDDNVLVQGVSGEKYALGFFGFAYYGENKAKLKLLKVDGDKGAVLPSSTTIEDGSYAPLSRPLFIYVRQDALAKPQVANFVGFYLENAGRLSAEVGYVRLPAEKEAATRSAFDASVTATAGAK